MLKMAYMRFMKKRMMQTMDKNNICPNCGYEWNSKDTKACPKCNFTGIVSSYKDNGFEVNVDEFKSVVEDRNNRKRTQYECSCGYKINIYGKGLHGITCSHCFKNMAEVGDIHIQSDSDWNYNRKLERARIELAASEQSTKQRHLYMCLSCDKTTVQKTYDGERISCDCGGEMMIRYSLIDGELYNAITGEVVGKKRKATKAITGNQLKDFRKNQGLNQAELGGMFNLTQQFISQIENGIRPLPDDIKHAIN